MQQAKKFDLLKVEQDFPKNIQWLIVGYVQPREEDWTAFERMAHIEFMRKHGKVLVNEILDNSDERYYEVMFNEFLMMNHDTLREMYRQKYPERSSLIRMWKVYKCVGDFEKAKELAREYRERDGCDFTVTAGGTWSAYNPPEWLCEKTDYCNDKMNELMKARAKHVLDIKKHKAERSRLLLEKTITESGGKSKHRNDSLNNEAMEHRKNSPLTFDQEFKYYDQKTINSLRMSNKENDDVRRDFEELKEIEEKLHELEQRETTEKIDPIFVAKKL